MKELIIYRCNLCGNLITMIENSGVTPNCCGEEMERLSPNTVDANMEKHVPAVRQDGVKMFISVGNLPHPMAKEHFIQWILLQTDRGIYYRELYPEHMPEAMFTLQPGERPLRAYAWCNLHGLWMKESEG